jgi:hypothetical protein
MIGHLEPGDPVAWVPGEHGHPQMIGIVERVDRDSVDGDERAGRSALIRCIEPDCAGCLAGMRHRVNVANLEPARGLFIEATLL